jgi:hypothetical protein
MQNHLLPDGVAIDDALDPRRDELEAPVDPEVTDRDVAGLGTEGR